MDSETNTVVNHPTGTNGKLGSPGRGMGEGRDYGKGGEFVDEKGRRVYRTTTACIPEPGWSRWIPGGVSSKAEKEEAKGEGRGRGRSVDTHRWKLKNTALTLRPCFLFSFL